MIGFLALDVDLHKTNNFAPNEFRGVVNSSGLVVYKGSTQKIKDSMQLPYLVDWSPIMAPEIFSGQGDDGTSLLVPP